MPKRHTPMPGKVKFSFNREGNGDRHYALTRIAMTNGYYVVVNDRLRPTQYCQRLTSQGDLGLSIPMNMKTRESRAV